jgi:hypothetical protein
MEWIAHHDVELAITREDIDLMRPPSGCGSMPWQTAFSSNGCNTSAGMRA